MKGDVNNLEHALKISGWEEGEGRDREKGRRKEVATAAHPAYSELGNWVKEESLGKRICHSVANIYLHSIFPISGFK